MSKLDDVRSATARHLDQIRQQWTRPYDVRVTLIVRVPWLDDGDFILTDDSVPDVIAALEKLAATGQQEVCAIWSGEWRAWWRDRSCGYTENAVEAGFYSRAKAEQIARRCGPEKKIEIKPHPIFALRDRVNARIASLTRDSAVPADGEAVDD